MPLRRSQQHAAAVRECGSARAEGRMVILRSTADGEPDASLGTGGSRGRGSIPTRQPGTPRQRGALRWTIPRACLLADPSATADARDLQEDCGQAGPLHLPLWHTYATALEELGDTRNRRPQVQVGIQRQAASKGWPTGALRQLPRHTGLVPVTGDATGVFPRYNNRTSGPWHFIQGVYLWFKILRKYKWLQTNVHI